MIHLINGNSFDFSTIAQITPKIDLVLTDPPWNVSRPNNFTSMGRTGIDFGTWDKNFTLTWIQILNQITSKNASVLIFCSNYQISYYIDILEQHGFIFKDVLRWIKTNPMPRNITRRYVVDYENILWFVKIKSKWTFNKPNDIPYLRPEIYSSHVAYNERIHPTQKHLQVLETLLKIHSNENDYVLDLFMGSGSVGIACKKLNRNFFGVEINETYFNQAQEWINNS